MSRKLIYLISFVLVLVLAGNGMAQLDPATVTTGHVYVLGRGDQVPDSSANNLTGNIVGDPQVVDILGGRALQFDGVDDGIHIPDSQFINVTNGPWTDRTVVALFNCADVNKPEMQTVFEEGGRTRGLTIYVHEGLAYVGGWNRAEYEWNPGSWISAPIGSNEWHAVAFVIRDGADATEDDKFEMWMDGALIGKAPGGQMYNHANDNAIGYTKENNVFHDDTGTGDGWFFEGIISKVWILNEALTEVEFADLMVGPQPAGEPLFLDPVDGAEVLETTAMLSWRLSDLATSHNVYMGANADEVAAGTAPAVSATLGTILAGSADGPIPEGLAAGTTYYWRVEAVNPDDPNSPWTSEVKSLWLRPELATEPSPADGTINLSPAAVDISWNTGFGAIMQTVALGTDPAALVAGPPLVMDMPYESPALELETTYYWQISTFDGVSWKPGPVWSFSTLPVKVADITDPNLMGWWTFDEGPLSASALDQSGNERHGTLMGNAVLVADGVEGGAVSLGGGGTYVNIDGYKGIVADRTDPNNPFQQAFTVACWIKTTGNGEMISWGSSDGTGVGGQYMTWRIDGGTVRAEHGNGNLRGNTVVNDGEWHHVAKTVVEGGNLRVPNCTLYVDGRKDTIFSGSDNIYNVTEDADVAIGRRADQGDRHFPGMIDDVRIYDRAMSREEIHDAFADVSQAWWPEPEDRTATDIWSLSELSWRPGEGAVKHDVYIGTNADAVAAADTSDTTGIYQGRQSETTFTLGSLNLGTTYYWRVDELVPAALAAWKGNVWSFSTAAELVLYDEATPFPYDNSADPFLSEISLDLDPALDLTDPFGRLAVSYTGQAGAGSVTVDDAAGTVTMVGRGADIWGTADEFQYAYTTLTGDGSMTVKVDSLASTDNWTKAGIMIRESLDAGSAFAAVFATGNNGVRFQARAMTDQDAESDTSVATDEQKALAAPVWIKIERTFPMISAYYSTDGVAFTPMSWNPQVIPMSPAPIHIGLAVTSHSGAETYADAVFSELSSTGGVAAGPLTSAEIGLESNSAEPMYLVLTDASGATAAVLNPDPAATLQTSATDFTVDLADYAIDLAAVAKVSLVIGDFDAPAPGGSGSLTINNVRLLAKGPVGHWPLDDGEGAVAVDLSGSGNDGTINNPNGGLGPDGSVWVDDPERGTVISFNGTADGAFVRAGDIPQMILTNDFTWAFWAKHSAENTADNDIILGNRMDENAVDFVPRQFIKFTPTKFEWHMNGNGDDNLEYDDIPADVWIHHAVVKTADQLTYYRDGVEASSGTITQALDVPQPLFFGGDNENAEGENWRGLLSDARIYDRALSADEVLALASK